MPLDRISESSEITNLRPRYVERRGSNAAVVCDTWSTRENGGRGVLNCFVLAVYRYTHRDKIPVGWVNKKLSYSA